MATQNPNRFYNLATKGHMPSNIRPAPQCVFVATITAAGTQTITVPTLPTKANFVIFSSDANFYAKPNGTASAATATDGTGSELNPAAWGLDLLPDGTAPVNTIGLYSTPGANVTMAFYLQD